jgi:hypothetical protein
MADNVARPSSSTVTDEGLVERLNKLKQLEDDVRHYNGNEASGYAEIARRKSEIFDELASGHTALLREIEELREALSGMLPKNVCLTNRNVRDATIVSLECTMGELRKVAALSRPLDAPK